MMDVKIYSWALALLVLFSSGVYAMECDVEFSAKRVHRVSTWFGKVEKPEFISGVVSGQGANKRACLRDALSDVKQDGWIITQQRMINPK